MPPREVTTSKDAVLIGIDLASSHHAQPSIEATIATRHRQTVVANNHHHNKMGLDCYISRANIHIPLPTQRQHVAHIMEGQ